MADAAERDAAGRFLAAVVLARVPVFAFQAVQAVLVPAWTRALTLGDRALFRRELGRGLAAIAALGAACAGAGAVAGPRLLALVFGPAYGVGALDLVALSVAATCHLACLMFQAGVVALGLHRFNAACWAAGLLVFCAGCLLPLPAVARVETAMTLSSAAVAVLLGLRLRHAAAQAPRAPQPPRPPWLSRRSWAPLLPQSSRRPPTPVPAPSREKDVRSPSG